MGVVQNSIDIEKCVAEVMTLAAEIGDENSGIIKDIDDLQEANANIMTSVRAIDLELAGKQDEITPTVTQRSAASAAIESITTSSVISYGNVHTCRVIFTVGDANIAAWTADLISFADPDLYCFDLVADVRDLTDPTKNTVETVLLTRIGNPATHVGFTTSKALTAGHRYSVAFTYVNE